MMGCEDFKKVKIIYNSSEHYNDCNTEFLDLDPWGIWHDFSCYLCNKLAF